jgi:prepilin-type processing-associated H-X9-DG protein/prepilin-type N-terminal cleavage/methylation domain-containing protein
MCATNEIPACKKGPAFTLIELLVVISIIGILAMLSLGGIGKVRSVSEGAVCAHSLRQLDVATHLYLQDHDNRFFPYYEDKPEGRRWFFGMEPKSSLGGQEGTRTVDVTQSFLYPYIHQVGGIEICRSFPYGSDYWKPKFKGASFGYGYNILLASDTSVVPAKLNQPKTLPQIDRPSAVILFGDCAQVNTFQAPASQSNPKLEEFYMINDTDRTIHFRHGNSANILFLDGHVEKFQPHPGTIDPRLQDECIGRITPKGSLQFLQ